MVCVLLRNNVMTSQDDVISLQKAQQCDFAGPSAPRHLTLCILLGMSDDPCHDLRTDLQIGCRLQLRMAH
jgi:hypothetical protein